MYKHAKTVNVKKNPISGKMLPSFVEKVRNEAISHFLVTFCGPFWNFCQFSNTSLVFWAFYTVLLQIGFVITNALFRVKSFWLKPWWFKKKTVFSHLWSILNLTKKPWKYLYGLLLVSPWLIESISQNVRSITSHVTRHTSRIAYEIVSFTKYKWKK